MSRRPDPTEEIALRLRALLEAVDLDQTAAAKRIGVSTSRLGNWLSGKPKTTITIANAVKVCDEFGATLDWICRAKRDRLPHELVLALVEIDKRGGPKPKSGRGPRPKKPGAPVVAKRAAPVKRGSG